MDVGSISTKGVIVDEGGQVLAGEYAWTEGDPVGAVKGLLRVLENGLPQDVRVMTSGVTGSARRLVGAMLCAEVVKNEITAHAVGTLSRHPDARTIFEIGGQDSKIILIDDGVVTDYAMNTLCAAGTGAFLSSQAKRLGVAVEELGDIAAKAERPARIAARCAVFAESDMVHKAQTGSKKEELIAGLCSAVVTNYLNNVAKGKRITPPVVFQGGVSKNAGVVRAFREQTGLDIIVDGDSHLLGAVGSAILAKAAQKRRGFSFEIADMDFETSCRECDSCANRCEIVSVRRNGELLDSWGSRCQKNGRAV